MPHPPLSGARRAHAPPAEALKNLVSELREKEAMLEAAQRLARLGSWSLDLRTGALWWSPEADRIFGLQAGALQELSLARFLDHVHPADRGPLEALIAQAGERRLAAAYAYRFLGPGGDVKMIRGEGESQVDESGRVWRLVGTLMDVSEEEQLLREARLRDERLRLVTESEAVWLWEQDAQFRFTLLAPGEVHALGSGALGKTRWEAGFRPLSGLWDEHRKCLEQHRPFRNFEFWAGEGAQARVVSTTGAPVFAPDGSFAGYRGTAQDVTSLKRAQLALVESEERYRLLFEASSDAIIEAGPGGTIRRANPAACVLFGRSEEEMRGRACTELAVPGDGRLADLVRQRVAVGQSRDELTMLRADGSRFEAEVSAVACRTSDGALLASLVVRDLTERLRHEQELLALNAQLEQRVRQRTRELEAANEELRGFAHALAHDLRGSIASLVGFGEALQRLLDGDASGGDGGKERHYAGRMVAAALRLGGQTEALLALARVSQLELAFAEVDLSAVARSVLDELRQREPGRAVACQVQPGLRAHGDARLLRVLLENLLGNAWKFTARRGPARIAFEAGPGAGDERVFCVRDNGAGFDMAHADRLFGNFQRLHDEGEFAGTGLGLASVRRIVVRHGGRVWAEARPGAGAAFYFTLPAGA
ncbi:MAG TPA: PAS domain S-box protein [Ramlibacter sp.]